MVYKDVDPIKTVTLFDVQWSDTPEPVAEEVRQYWRDLELGNDFFYVTFDVEEQEDSYPLIAEYLRNRGIKECLMHYWW